MNEAQQRAFSLAVSGHNLYIRGQAGTGKTWLLQRIHTTLSQTKNVHVTCTTGIACSNFGAACKSQTVHSWSGTDDGR
uniref:ATP-dependent DNA helicase n=1 Tax=Magallana gigas TaxID=29159 RepID=K1PBF6_MAGGI